MRAVLELMKDGINYRTSVLEVLDNNSLQQGWGHLGVPDSLRVDHYDRSHAAHAETGSFTPLHTLRPEKQVLALQQLGEQRVNLTPPAIGRAETARTHDDVARVRLHLRDVLRRHRA